MALYKSRVTDKIYYGCATCYANGERKMIASEKYERCLIPTANPFWNQPLETNRMQTRNSTKKRQLIIGLFKYVQNLQR